MRIAVGCDHRGLNQKEFVLGLLAEAGHGCQDFGAYDTESVDYPDIAREVAGAVARSRFEQGILICGTGIGMSIAANKVKGIRAALCCDVLSARRARQHNNANILCLGAEWEQELIRQIVEAYFSSEFEGGRHQRRVDKIAVMEE